MRGFFPIKFIRIKINFLLFNHKKNMKKNEPKVLKELKVKIIPLADRVLLREILEEGKETKTEFGIYIPETVDTDKGAKKGEVVAVGTGRYEDGKLIPVLVEVGDIVLYQWGDKVEIDGGKYVLVRENEISAIIK